MATATAPTRRFRFSREEMTPSKLWLFVWWAAGVRIPNVRVCPNHCTPWEAFCDAFFAESDVAIWKASRGFGGKSYLLALLSWCEAILLRARVNLLGGSGEQSRRVLEAMGRFWMHEHAPAHLLASQPAQQHTRLKTNASITALLASTASVRGPHPQRLRMDEVDEMPIKILDAATGQPMEDDGVKEQTVLSSTHHYTDGTMTAMLERAHDRKWPVFEWCYKETAEPHGWLRLAQIERKRGMVSSAMWANEYELQDPLDQGRRAFPSFSRALHVRETEAEYDPLLPLWMSTDPGRGPGAYCVGYWQPFGDNSIRMIGEETLDDHDTYQAIDVIKSTREWWDRIEFITPDPSGNKQTEQSDRSTHDKFRLAFPRARIRTSYDPEHRNPEKRAEMIREKLLDARGRVHVEINPSCVGMIWSLSKTHFPEIKPGRPAGDKIVKDGTEHHVDEFGYFIVNFFHVGAMTASRKRLV